MKISKESFKTFFSECPKIFYMFNNIDNFKKVLSLYNEEKISILSNVDLEEESFGSSNSSSFDILLKNERILSADESKLTLEELEKKKYLLDKYFNDSNYTDIEFSGVSIEDGNQVGILAREYFDRLLFDENQDKTEKLLSYSFEKYSFKDALEKTKEVILNKKNKYVYEPAFECMDGLLRTRCDILVNKNNNHVDIIEIKAATKIKNDFFYDVMYQYFVLTKCGYIVDNIFIGYLNSSFLQPKNEINYKSENERIKAAIEDDSLELDFNYIKNQTDLFLDIKEYDSAFNLDLLNTFIVENIFKDHFLIELIKDFDDNFSIEYLLTKMIKLLDLDEEKVLGFLLEKQEDKFSFSRSKKSDSRFNKKLDNCTEIIEYIDFNEANIFDVPNTRKSSNVNFLNIFGKKYFCEIEDIYSNEWVIKNKHFFNSKNLFPINLIKDFNGSIKDFEKVDPSREDELSELLNLYQDKIIYMYDFETSLWAIPKFKNSFTYQQIPFQYSIHILNHQNLESLDDSIKHFNFIASEKKDPRFDFAKNFVRDMFSEGEGIYVAYYKSFEVTRLIEMAILFPDFENIFIYLAKNTKDLHDFFKNQLIYTPEFKRSSSIKVTQPTLYPELSYKELIVNKGDQASELFRRYIDDFISEEEWKNFYIKDMMLYCDRDTWAMVVLLKRIFEIYNDYLKNKELNNNV